MPHTLPLPLSDARKRFFDGEELPEGTVAPAILRSWQRCLALGLPANGLHSERLESTDLAHCLDANHPWLQLARLQVENLYESVVDDGHVVIVADKHGMILEQIGHPDFLDKAERVALTPGMDWREDRRGTNAIGTALLLNGNILVRGREHYLERNRHPRPLRRRRRGPRRFRPAAQTGAGARQRAGSRDTSDRASPVRGADAPVHDAMVAPRSGPGDVAARRASGI
jgi:hypothetical protein